MNRSSIILSFFLIIDAALAADSVKNSSSYALVNDKPNNSLERKESISPTSREVDDKKTYNFYVGLISSYDFGKVNISSSETLDNLPIVRSSHLSLQGLGGGAIVGVNKYFGQFLLGLEASAEADSGKEKQTNSTTNGGLGAIISETKVKKKGALGLSVRGGYQCNENTLVYAKLGATSSKYTTEIRNQDGQSTFAKINKNFIGPTAALGTEIKISDSISGRVEFSHTHYAKKNITFSNGQATNNRLSFKPQSNKITVGIVVPLNK